MRQSFTGTLLLLLAMLSILSCGSGEDKAARLIEKSFDDGVLHGAASLTVDGQIVTRHLSLDVSEASAFRLASLTKVFTQLAILRLVDEGELGLDQTLADALPGMEADWSRQVTIRQLLNFSSGLPSEVPDTEEGEGVVFDENGMAASFLISLEIGQLDFEPGTRTQYSNLGYFYLGAVLEAHAGGTYAQAIEELVIRPAGLKNTGFGADQLDGEVHLKGYETNPEGDIVEAVLDSVSARYSSGGMFGSLQDLERLSAIVLGDDFLSVSGRDEFFTQCGRAGADDPAYVTFTGHVPGFANGWVLSRQPHVVMISLNNRVGENPRAFMTPVLEAARLAGVALPENRERYQPTEAEGWMAISSLREIPEYEMNAVTFPFIEAMQSGDREEAFLAMTAMFGLDPAEMAAGDIEDYRGFVELEQGIFDRFGPFIVSAWRPQGNGYEVFLETEDDARGVRYRFDPSSTNPGFVSGKRLGTYGFELTD
ncbi:serine hydrolase domain-containing protein [Parvularcula marina]|uniref:Class A beta-lactamase-related serine hydrolase n=1 Tax=Parvularcula marina TaxID=2292771 RepID=A0A371RKE2_9PROT|nr:serine hydrolase domain-containing protein [Parvularcula marina]RFB05923.1 class A beta-lactamase-related serine hydrolase [Parvularcula marina]